MQVIIFFIFRICTAKLYQSSQCQNPLKRKVKTDDDHSRRKRLALGDITNVRMLGCIELVLIVHLTMFIYENITFSWKIF